MLDPTHFADVLTGIAQTLPYGKPPSQQALMLCWQTMPAQAKAQLSNAHWSYAAGQYVLDPDRPKELPVFLALLRYLYRLENGQPNFDWGLKTDLLQRMADPGTFHPQPTPIYLQPTDDQPTTGPAVVAGLNRLFELPGERA